MKKVPKGIVLIATVTLLALPTTSHAERRARGAYLEISEVDRSTKPKSNVVSWYWEPFFPVGLAELGVFVRCQRTDENGNLTGNNKVTIKDVEITSVNGTLTATFPKESFKMKGGDTGWKNYDAQFMEPLVAEGPALGVGVFQVKGKLARGDTLNCYLDVTETVGGSLRSSSSARALSGESLGVGALEVATFR